MSLELQILIALTSFMLILIILDMIRRGRLREEYSLIWLASAALVFLLAVFRGSLDFIAGLLNIEYSPSLIFMIGFGLVILTQLFQTVALSKLTSNNRELAQKVSLLELRLRYHLTQVAPQLITTVTRLSLEHFDRFNQEFKQSFDLNKFLQHTLELALDSLRAESGSVIVINTKGELFQAALSSSGEEIKYDTQKIDDTLKQGLAGWVLKTHQPALVLSTFDDPRWLKLPWDETTGPRSAMSVPLVANEDVIGAITVVQRQARQFTENDLAILMSIAAVISITGAEYIRPTQPGFTRPSDEFFEATPQA